MAVGKRRARSGSRSAGFTLIELMVVLALVALAIAFVPPLISRGLPATELKAATREVAAGLREARSQAIARNEEIVFSVDVEERSWRIGGEAKRRRVPGGLDLALFTAQSELLDAAEGNIRFYADGSSTGGRVRLSGESGAYDVTIDWLTGRVEIHR